MISGSVIYYFLFPSAGSEKKKLKEPSLGRMVYVAVHDWVANFPRVNFFVRKILLKDK